ncbi:hypothetical protein NDU88_009975 [Pleurodeles waltl]|uniref:Uncharacterized protein n=1 Tax=Pleurodeles waltl TaxID=8319 RepID=A0AAV7PUE3_PLEWA|nr:hypothetical protein NDU88_009975 [Pleurodeles waltl]
MPRAISAARPRPPLLCAGGPQPPAGSALFHGCSSPGGGGASTGLHRCPGLYRRPIPSVAGAASRLSPIQLRISRAGRRALLACVRHAW